MNTAKLIQDNLPGFAGHAALYQVNPPLKRYDNTPHEYVIASASSRFGDETYLFPSNASGDVTSWREMPGSQEHTLSHTKIFTDLDYEIILP